MAFKISLLSDVAGFLKGTTSVEDALGDVSDSLDDLARSSAQDANKAAEALEREFKDAFDQVKTGAKTTGRTVGDDLGDGSRKASEGVSDLKDEVKQSGKEMAASFDGSAQSVSDLVQEIAANALPALGPAGAAAGIAMALGLGAGITALQAAKDKADQAKQKALDLADAIADAGGNPELVNWAEQLRDTLKEIVDTKEWYEFWQSGPVDRLTDWTAKAKQFGISMGDAARAAAGDQSATKTVVDSLNASIDSLNQSYAASAVVANDASVTYDESFKQAADSATAFRDDILSQSNAVAQATTWQKAYADATKGLSQAQGDATTASKTFTDNLTENLSVADDGLKDFVHKGKLSLDQWTQELKDRAAENKTVEDFTVTIAPKLSTAALENFAKLPTETQAQIARAFKSGDAKDKQRVIANLEAEAKVSKITIDTSGAQAVADKNPIQVPTTVDASGAVQGTKPAASKAQAEANKADNAIEFKTRIDIDELQRQVNRAAASITPPTIWVKTKVKKDVP